jgi:hypothetical protein
MAALALPVCAQVHAVSADIPFGFTAGGTTMPAGKYNVDMPSDWFVVALVGPDQRTFFLSSTPEDARSRPESSVLVFHQYGNRYFLSEIRTPGRSREIPESRMEREAAKTASAGRADRVIVMAMR